MEQKGTGAPIKQPPQGDPLLTEAAAANTASQSAIESHHEQPAEQTSRQRQAVLTRMLSMQPARRPSIKILRKQRSSENGPSANDDEPSTRSVLTQAIPKLYKQLSMATHRSASHDHAVPTPSPEEQLKTQRYERMMDRFQLRRVVTSRSTSSATHRDAGRTSSESRPASCRNSVDSNAAHTPRFPQRRRVSDPEHLPQSESQQPTEDPEPERRRPSDQPPRVSRASTVSLLGPPQISSLTPTSAFVLQPCAPTSLFTRVRLAVLTTTFVSQVAYIPFGVVYYAPNHPLTYTMDAIVDIIFILNVAATCNTATVTPRGQLVTTRRAIWRHYRQHGFTVDFLASVPIELTLIPTSSHSWIHWVVRIGQVILRFMCVRRHINLIQAIWAKDVIGADKSIVAWLLYSRYSHLVRIGGIVLLITLMAHYLACMWAWLLLDVGPDLLETNDPFTLHMRSIYEALQLLQGQGVTTTTPAQDAFGSIAVLLGSIALAVVFGHVAILVANFSANDTSYQRKMESVFAVMTKLQLPYPIRERVHQYYEYLHAEYESLDGEVVKFAKDLSHTLELEVVLFKYMDVVMHVPHWRECSPDFQKQLVLHLSVRVYLPDDFIMRRGEVGTECYIINRGTCKLCEYTTGNYEHPTLPMISEAEDAPRVNGSTSVMTTPRKTDNGVVRPHSRYSVHDAAPSEFEQMDVPYNRVTVLRRGQAIGDMALLANYERSSDLRAVTYVEMCVLEREVFQKILTRYPRDRELVLASIVHHTMVHLEAERVPCMLMRMVHDVTPRATLADGIEMVVRAMNPPENDPSIVFGVTEQMSGRLWQIAMEQDDGERSHAADSEDTGAHSNAQASCAVPPPVRRRSSISISQQEMHDHGDGELVGMIQEIRERLQRIESRQENPVAPKVVGQPICPTCSLHNPRPTAVKLAPLRPSPLKPVSSRGLKRRHTVIKPLETVASASMTSETTRPLFSMTPRADPPVKSTDSEPSTRAPSTSRRLLQDLVESLWTRPTDSVAERQSPTPCADQLFQSKRNVPSADIHKHRRSSLRRTNST